MEFFAAPGNAFAADCTRSHRGARLHYTTILLRHRALWHNPSIKYFGMEMSSFVSELQGRLDDMERRAKAAGSNMTQVCKATGIARITFERWVSRAPQVFYKLDEMEAEVQRLERGEVTHAPGCSDALAAAAAKPAKRSRK